jgi:hypothetical protein
MPSAITRDITDEHWENLDASPPAGVVRPSCPQTSHPFPTAAQNLAPTAGKLQPHPSCFRFSNSSTYSRSRLPQTQHH